MYHINIIIGNIMRKITYKIYKKIGTKNLKKLITKYKICKRFRNKTIFLFFFIKVTFLA